MDSHAIPGTLPDTQNFGRSQLLASAERNGLWNTGDERQIRGFEGLRDWPIKTCRDDHSLLSL